MSVDRVSVQLLGTVQGDFWAQVWKMPPCNQDEKKTLNMPYFLN